MSVVFKPPKPFIVACKLILTLCSMTGAGFAQSTDISSPSPVRTNEVVGAIAARDLGDSRRTDHFYAFVGNPGDLLITIKSENLNGDVDVFTGGSLRPLLKFTLYAESSLPVTKSIYLRRREDLVLRVEARSPNDDEGIYHIRLGGSFEPMAGEPLLAATDNPEPTSPVAAVPSRGKNTRRVSSVGARIPEPPPPPEDVAVAAPTPEPTPEPTPVEAPTPAATPDRIAETEAPAPAPRRTRGRAPAGRRRPASPPAKKEETTAASETASKARTPEAAESDATAPPPGRRTGRRGATSRPAESTQEPEPQTGPRLIIEMQDGTRVERFMNTIRRVTVENNQIVVVGKSGKIERIRMSEVIRMSIEP